MSTGNVDGESFLYGTTSGGAVIDARHPMAWPQRPQTESVTASARPCVHQVAGKSPSRTQPTRSERGPTGMTTYRRTLTMVMCGVALTAQLTACAPGSGPPKATPTTSPSPASGVRGQTLVDIGCPVLRDATACPERPVAARLTVTRSGPDPADVVHQMSD